LIDAPYVSFVQFLNVYLLPTNRESSDVSGAVKMQRGNLQREKWSTPVAIKATYICKNPFSVSKHFVG
jgi:hypothetical protein